MKMLHEGDSMGVSLFYIVDAKVPVKVVASRLQTEDSMSYRIEFVELIHENIKEAAIYDSMDLDPQESVSALMHKICLFMY